MELNPELVMQIQAEQVGNLMKENAMLRAAIIQFEQELYPQQEELDLGRPVVDGETVYTADEVAERLGVDTNDLPIPEEAV